MFVMRRARIEDVPTLLKLARMVHFINLPADKDIISDKIQRSRESFGRAAAIAGGQSLAESKRTTESSEQRAESANGKRSGGGGAGRRSVETGIAAVTSRSDLFMFVLEDVDSGGVLGTSQIIAHMGGPGAPNVSLHLSTKEMFSTSLQFGTKHVVAKLVLDESGPTEIGGLILQPSYRGHKLKLGRFLSLVRFHAMGLYRPLFSDRVLAEMMAPITLDGRSTLWEYLGRRFINLSYTEADRFCQYSKEFMTSLLPREEIYLTLLPPEARAVVGQVGPETVPARRMLEKLGFAYLDKIDPFDGGPHLEAKTDEITIVRNTRTLELGEAASAAACDGHGIVSVIDADGEFRSLETAYCEERGVVRVMKQAMKAIRIEPGARVGLTPIAAPNGGSQKRTRGGASVNGKAPKGARGGKTKRSRKAATATDIGGAGGEA
ncbi:MAG: arginine N-succinyltransferase [Phycisphaerales bacterium]|nr:arginine N-succinyltransferase [Phycisphaerales bacterium]